MSDTENGHRFIGLAERDLRTAQGMTDPREFGLEAFGFFAQQAAEKALKAWLCAVDVHFSKTHDLDVLFSMLEQAGEHEAKRFLHLRKLTEFAVERRYSLASQEDEEFDRPDTVKQVKSLVEFVRTRLEGKG
jgi:HEPN domain-containing protein